MMEWNTESESQARPEGGAMRIFTRDGKADAQRSAEDEFSVALQKEKQWLGTILLEAGHIDESQLDEAMKEAQQRGERLGRVLIDKQLISGRELVQLLAASRGVLRDVAEEGMEMVNEEGAAREVTSRLKVVAENAPDVEQVVTLTVTPPVRTTLEIEQAISPQAVPDDETTPVTYEVVIRNTRRATGRNIQLVLDGLPACFHISEIRLDGRPMSQNGNKRLPLEIGEIGPGQSKAVTIVGTASPSGQDS